jgi:hypothetical protein
MKKSDIKLLAKWCGVEIYSESVDVDSRSIYTYEWNPYKNFADCEVLLDKLTQLTCDLSLSYEGYGNLWCIYITLDTEKMQFYTSKHKYKTHAICNACVKLINKLNKDIKKNETNNINQLR